MDVTPLGAHEYIRVSDLKLPEGVKVLDDADRVIVGVTIARAEVSEASAEAEVAEPEVVKKGKAEGEA